MNNKKTLIPTLVLLVALAVMPACSSLPQLTTNTVSANAPVAAATATTAPATTNNNTTTTSSPAASTSAIAGNASGMVAAYEGTLEEIYARVNPSVVAIHVVSQVATTTSSDPFSQFPGFNSPQGNSTQVQEALGSGFVWDTAGHIVTNNHVIDGADKIEVTFSDGSTVAAKLVGADPDSDLAVIQVDVSADTLHPVSLADSTQVQVGQLAIALGNPFGLENTMTVGIVSALGRTLPAGESSSSSSSPTYSIPDIIQTDAPINPGNSGGVLLDAQGQVVGVTAAIESTSQSNAGIGFVIPSQIVSNVIPALIKDGYYQHPWLGISGTSLTPDLDKAMNLDATQRGVLVATVTTGSPAEKAGLKGSTGTTTITGTEMPIGGDVILAINGEPTYAIDDLIAYLAESTDIGQQVQLTILRDGKQQTLDVTLAARPSDSGQQSASTSSESGQVYLGIKVTPLTTGIDQAMDLPSNARGLLIQDVESGSPADVAGLKGSSDNQMINGQMVSVGGDILVAIDGIQVTTQDELEQVLAQYSAGDPVTLTIVRGGRVANVDVTLAAKPM